MIKLLSLISFATALCGQNMGGSGQFICRPEHSGSSSSCDSSMSECSEEATCKDFVLRHPCHSERKGIKGIVCPQNMVSLHHCPSKKRKCTPYIEFTRIVEFFIVIPGAPKLFSFIESNDIKSLERLASKSSCSQNYDAMSAFFYAADSFLGLKTHHFSYDFILFFLTRFYYFLNICHIDNVAVFNGVDLVYIENRKPVDLLDIPSVYNNATFGTEANACHIFNTIITDTTITKIVLDFILVISAQITIAVGKCTPGFCPPSKNFTTYDTYVALLTAYLNATAELTSVNLLQKIEFIKPQTQFAFIVLPFLATPNASTKSFYVLDLDATKYFNVNNTARFV